jgi:hypothetical protein
MGCGGGILVSEEARCRDEIDREQMLAAVDSHAEGRANSGLDPAVSAGQTRRRDE